MHPLLQWNLNLLLAMSPYIGEPNMIQTLASLPLVDASLGSMPTMWKADGFVALHYVLCTDDVKSQRDHTTHVFPRSIPLPCRSSSSLQHSDWLEPQSSCWEGAPVEALQPIHSLTGPVGQAFASHLGEQWFVSWGWNHSYNGTGFSCQQCLTIY
jgi:hypothetical protein